MRIKELSIGDWVQDKKGTKAQILGIEKWSDGYELNVRLKGVDVGNTPATSAHPIPLTPEILEKNGFVKAELATVIEWYHWRDIFIGFKDGLIYTSINGREIWGMRHVHQLQHALRLGGIEKEIEL